ncbi:TetR-like C-terminal domain-containing protein [Sulfitobacter pontiacus]|uniref:TetR-like C-terminal domain-containing protein n=1 Tax=Sulfitobacter pontiacus TaxID=60137 RepID=UPI00228688C0|nr:TetR-like C-terminal domain-containing protein [Sulfitobacter pontiacus]
MQNSTSRLANFVLPREEMVTALLRRAQDRGELSPGRNVETLLALIHGAFWYRLLNRWVLDAGFAREIVAETFA